MAQWEAQGGGRKVKFDDWVDHLEVPSHFRTLLGLEELAKPRSMSALQVSSLLDDLTFPSLMVTRVRVPAARMVFAGRGPAEARLRALAPEAHFTGWLDRETLACWFRASTLLLFPSRFDTFGCAVLEALSCALPVACYPVKGPADLIQDGVNGLVCQDPADMAERVAAHLAAPASRHQAFQHQALGTALRYQAVDIMDRLLADVGPLSRAVSPGPDRAGCMPNSPSARDRSASS